MAKEGVRDCFSSKSVRVGALVGGVLATTTQMDYHQSLTPSYALQLRSFPWLTAAYAYYVSNSQPLND